MQLILQGRPTPFTPISLFRRQYDLPDDFGMTWFIEKDFNGRGSIEGASEALHAVHDAIVQAVPHTTPPEGWLAHTVTMRMRFRDLLLQINEQIGLHRREIDFAVAGFGDIYQRMIYTHLEARMTLQPAPSLAEVYVRWVSESAQRSVKQYSYKYGDETWRIQFLRTVYGRFGMIIHTPNEIAYVYDPVYLCPAHGWVAALLNDVSAKLRAVFEGEPARSG